MTRQADQTNRAVAPQRSTSSKQTDRPAVSRQSYRGLNAAKLAVGGVIGPLGAGRLAQRLGYNGFFCIFAGIAGLAAIVFLTLMPETGDEYAQPFGKKVPPQ